jgi:hypothetical protein
MSVQRNTIISSGNVVFVACNSCQKNNAAFYKIVFASSKGKRHPSLEESCREGYNIAFLKEQTL